MDQQNKFHTFTRLRNQSFLSKCHVSVTETKQLEMFNIYVKVKGKVIPVTGHEDP
jgi:hypothetical protein